MQSKVQKRKGSLGAPQVPTSVKGIARMMSDRKLGVDVKVRKFRLKSYKDCFVGRAISTRYATGRSDIEQLLRQLTGC